MIKAKTIMTENVITINENATIEEAAKLIVKKRVNSLLITKNNYPIAIVTENNLIKGTLNKNPKKVKVKDIMNKDFLTININANYSYIVKKLRNEKIKIGSNYNKSSQRISLIWLNLALRLQVAFGMQKSS